MSNFSIGLSALRVAQQAIDLIGTNVANVGSEGYHRQELRIAPEEYGTGRFVSLGGVEIAETRRAIDQLLESEFLRQQPALGQIDQELSILRTIESALGTVDSSALTSALGDFFDSLRELSTQPNSLPLQEQAVWAADTLAGQIRQIAQYVIDLEVYVVQEANGLCSQVNDLVTEIAELNYEIQNTVTRGGSANMLADRRDQAIMELSSLIDVQTRTAEHGMVNVFAWGGGVVIGANCTQYEMATTADGKLGIGFEGDDFFRDHFRGGRLGGLMSLKNDIVTDFKSQLDSLAGQIVQQINTYQVQGIGQAGSFTSLTGVPASADPVGDWTDATVTSGDFYVRITNLVTGKTVRRTVTVDAANDTLVDIAAALDGLTDADATAALLSSVVDGKLTINVTDTATFRFDFLPVPIAEYDANWTAGNTAAMTVDGVYEGTSNQTYSVTVSGGGTVGVTAGLGLEVRNGIGQLVTTLNVGEGYAAGDILTLDNGITLSVSTGELVDTDFFTIPGLATTDETGVLAAAGMNTLFSGRDAYSIAVREELIADASRLATSLTATGQDNLNIHRIQGLMDAQVSALGDNTFGDFSRTMINQVGQEVAVRSARQHSLENISQQLMLQREEVSGVDINEETARLLVFQRQFQAAAKFLSTQDSVMQFLMETV
ncbi:MAG: flagellar hook-associated protein FlgK [Planctomycetota bacterium]|jgi:flagellar hook-associated protein 1 FlgK